MEITLYTAEFIQQVKREAAPKGCHPVQGFIEDQGFLDAYCQQPMSIYQLIQIAGCGVHVSKVAAWVIMEKHFCLN